jgi:hypothetical protein
MRKNFGNTQSMYVLLAQVKKDVGRQQRLYRLNVSQHFLHQTVQSSVS